MESDYLQSKTAERFKKELKEYVKRCGFKSIDKALKANPNLAMIPRETVSRYCSGTRKIQPDTCEIFAKEFGVRPEYLFGIDDYRTEADRIIGEKKKKNIFCSFHNLLVEMGYADLSMETEDYNCTFPGNTVYFLNYIKQLKESSDEIGNIEVLVDVNKDTFISISEDDYCDIVQDVIDYIGFRMNKYFATHQEEPVPDCILEDENHNEKKAPHPVMRVRTKDGRECAIRRRYVPTSQLPNYQMEELLEVLEEEEQ